MAAGRMLMVLGLLLAAARCHAGGAEADLQVIDNTTFQNCRGIGGGAGCSPGQIFDNNLDVENNGPADVIGAGFSATFTSNGGAPLTCFWNCVGTSAPNYGSCTASGTGNTIVDTELTLPAGASVRYKMSCYVPSSFGAGTVSYNAQVSTPADVTDPNPANNTVGSTATLVPWVFGLEASVSDGRTAVAPGDTVTYTISAMNSSGYADVPAYVYLSFPAAVTCSWTCQPANGASCTPSGSGSFLDDVYLPLGASTVYTATCAISSQASGSVSVSAEVSSLYWPSGPGGSTDTDTVLPLSDLAISIAHGTRTVPGLPIGYTITASNAGPADAPGSAVANTFPSGASCNWTCSGSGGATCATSGSGNIADTVSLPAGTSVAYQASCAIPSSATGTLTDNASIAPGSASADIARADNIAQDIAALTPQSDIAVSLFGDSHSYVQVGDVLTYTLLVSNAAGPSDATVSVLDPLPPQLSNGSWVCTASPGVACSAGSGQTLSATIALPAGGFVEYLYSARVGGADANDQLINAVTVGTVNSTDPNPANNSALDTDTVVIFHDGFESSLN